MAARFRAAPAALIGLAVGCALHAAARAWMPSQPLGGQGDLGDCLYVLTRGSITVRAVGSGARDALPQRYLSLSPGMMLGETAMLDGLGRSADAWADTASTVHALTGSALARLQRDDPTLVARLMTNVARHLSERLRNASLAWQRAAH